MVTENEKQEIASLVDDPLLRLMWLHLLCRRVEIDPPLTLVNGSRVQGLMREYHELAVKPLLGNDTE